MKRKKTHILGKHSAYLTENMTMILILLIIVTVTLSAFIKVKSLAGESKEQLMANVTAQNLIEYGKATQIRYDDVLMNLGAAKAEEQYYFYYDSDWKKVKKINGYKYVAAVDIQQEQLAGGPLKNIRVNVYKVEADKEFMIYSLSAKAY